MATPLIIVDKVSQSFGGRQLFRDVSFGLFENERAGLVGPNGSGKSTLLKILVGSLAPEGGTVSRRRSLKLGYLEQTPQFEAGATILSALMHGYDEDYDAHTRVYQLIAQMGLGQFPEDCPIENLSGGWQKRVALARELMIEPALLLLDEPTNHLDVSAILWLEDFLRQAPFAYLAITHDRLFLQRVADRILDLDPRYKGHLLDKTGSYAEYLETRDLVVETAKRHESTQKNKLRREREWLARGAQARQTKQKARQDAAAHLADSVRDLGERNQSKKVGLDFGDTLQSPKKLIEAKGLAKGFDDRHLFTGLDLLVTPKTRLAILGDNGCGKSTLIRVLIGTEKPSAGQVRIADDIQISYFEQNRETLDPQTSVLRTLLPEGDYVSFQGNYLHVRSYLDRFLFYGNKADLEVGRLSGGEQARLRLAQLMLNSAHILILDEPTNDLDSATLDVLADALESFPGAVLLITHDRYFMDQVATEILAFPPPASAEHSTLHRFADYYQWEAWIDSLSTQRKEKSKPSAASTPSNKKLSFKERTELESIEASIMKLESRLVDLQKQSEDPANFKDHVKLQGLHRDIAGLQIEIEQKYARWSELEARSKSDQPG